jgi:hypothetical protein
LALTGCKICSSLQRFALGLSPLPIAFFTQWGEG